MVATYVCLIIAVASRSRRPWWHPSCSLAPRLQSGRRSQAGHRPKRM